MRWQERQLLFWMMIFKRWAGVAFAGNEAAGLATAASDVAVGAETAAFDYVNAVLALA